jgi:chemotaxis protein methyltransferase CheR
MLKSQRAGVTKRERGGQDHGSMSLGIQRDIYSSFSESAPKTISEKEFLKFQELIYKEAGIWLSTVKTALLVGRLSKRLRQLDLKTFGEYYNIVAADAEERTKMLDAISTNETHFFREPAHFELLQTKIFPRWEQEEAAGLRSRKIRVWSAGCSTGQEPYSLAMVLLERFPATAGWEIEIVATDLSTRVLEIARNGIWDFGKASEIPDKYLEAFMLRGFGEQKGKIKAAPEIRPLIRFLRLNLNEESYPVQGPFDLVFCRNVLIYFDMPTRERIVRGLLRHLSPEGYFFVGHAESLHNMTDVIRSVIPTVYVTAAKAKREGHARR